MADASPAIERERTLVRLWGAFFAAPLAWAINQGVGYAVMKPVCAAAAGPVLVLIAAASLVLVLGGGWIAARSTRTLRSEATDDGSRALDRNYFVAVLAIALNALVGVMILTSLIPPLFLSPCE